MTIPPDVRDEDWFVRLRSELQTRGVPGRTIGEVTAEVDEHLRDSGERAEDAFGDPVDYAASLFPRTHATRVVMRVLLPLFAGMGAFVCSCWLPLSFTGHATGRWGHVIALVPWLVAAVPMVWTWSRLKTPWRRFLVYFVLYMLASGVGNWLRDTPAGLRTFTLDARIGWVLMFLGNAWVVLASRRGVHNRIIDPRTGLDRHAFPGWVWATVPWLVPAACAFVVLIRWAGRR